MVRSQLLDSSKMTYNKSTDHQKGKQLHGHIDEMIAPQEPRCGSVTFIES